mmetsp:Transcript_12797/g.37625  ORF Transcript_12797/g.37625 Transcript_12797/m.37625 type:complete len:148 (-) Transcript_12797:512-955(-)
MGGTYAPVALPGTSTSTKLPFTGSKADFPTWLLKTTSYFAAPSWSINGYYILAYQATNAVNYVMSAALRAKLIEWLEDDALDMFAEAPQFNGRGIKMWHAISSKFEPSDSGTVMANLQHLSKIRQASTESLAAFALRVRRLALQLKA